MQPEDTSPQAPQSQGSWEFRDEDQEVYLNGVSPDFEPITWTGSEFISRQKDIGWYVLLGGAIALVSGITFLISKDFISVMFIVVMGILFAVAASRKPRQLQFMIDDQGLHVGSKIYHFSDFKSFSVAHDGAIGHIDFLPLHRFQGELSVYYAPEDEQRIFEALSAQVPHEQRHETIVDRLVKLIHF